MLERKPCTGCGRMCAAWRQIFGIYGTCPACAYNVESLRAAAFKYGAVNAGLGEYYKSAAMRMQFAGQYV